MLATASYTSLAETYYGMERYTEAEELMIQVLDGRNRILGVEHPDTINARSNLVEIYKNLRKYRVAKKLDIKLWIQGAEILKWSTQIQSRQWHI